MDGALLAGLIAGLLGGIGAGFAPGFLVGGWAQRKLPLRFISELPDALQRVPHEPAAVEQPERRTGETNGKPPRRADPIPSRGVGFNHPQGPPLPTPEEVAAARERGHSLAKLRAHLESLPASMPVPGVTERES